MKIELNRVKLNKLKMKIEFILHIIKIKTKIELNSVKLNELKMKKELNSVKLNELKMKIEFILYIIKKIYIFYFKTTRN